MCAVCAVSMPQNLQVVVPRTRVPEVSSILSNGLHERSTWTGRRDIIGFMEPLVCNRPGRSAAPGHALLLYWHAHARARGGGQVLMARSADATVPRLFAGTLTFEFRANFCNQLFNIVRRLHTSLRSRVRARARR